MSLEKNWIQLSIRWRWRLREVRYRLGKKIWQTLIKQWKNLVQTEKMSIEVVMSLASTRSLRKMNLPCNHRLNRRLEWTSPRIIRCAALSITFTNRYLIAKGKKASYSTRSSSSAHRSSNLNFNRQTLTNWVSSSHQHVDKSPRPPALMVLASQTLRLSAASQKIIVAKTITNCHLWSWRRINCN